MSDDLELELEIEIPKESSQEDKKREEILKKRKEESCRYFNFGNCKRGNECYYKHDPKEAAKFQEEQKKIKNSEWTHITPKKRYPFQKKF